jgi:hypothetical protein
MYIGNVQCVGTAKRMHPNSSKMNMFELGTAVGKVGEIMRKVKFISVQSEVRRLMRQCSKPRERESCVHRIYRRLTSVASGLRVTQRHAVDNAMDRFEICVDGLVLSVGFLLTLDVT